MSRKRHGRKKAQKVSEVDTERTASRDAGRFDPDGDRKVESRSERPRTDDDDVLESRELDRDRMASRGPVDDTDEAEIADEDILEAIDIEEYRQLARP